ncbi:hypothetical protein PV379_04840 [Streptomyces caniscabiei]|uniref:hypothetical protein n=1 Tax=Streptomyces caniscabiei TaxID=2746961 RepID=UPI0029A40436|nr:hypothetical protein [Streptomyces caniscabiei]MDX2776657.1 hypothetical protein [Streptomyces caniscabiei]
MNAEDIMKDIQSKLPKKEPLYKTFLIRTSLLTAALIWQGTVWFHAIAGIQAYNSENTMVAILNILAAISILAMPIVAASDWFEKYVD